MKNLFSGKLISFEGVDGSGKSTLINKVNNYFAERGLNTFVTRELGGTPCAEKIRDIFKMSFEEDIYPETEILLSNASRSQHIRSKVIPAMNEGKLVLTDRFELSTKAYQCLDGSLTESHRFIHKNMNLGLTPFVVFFLKVDLKTSVDRCLSRGSLDRIESKGHSYFQDVIDRFDREVMGMNNVFVIDGTKSENEVFFASNQLHKRYRGRSL